MRNRLDLTPYVFVSAAFVYLIVFMGIPIGDGIRLGFTDTDTLNPTGGTSVGWENYTSVLKSSAFAHTLWATLIYTVGSVVFSLGLGLVAALAINSAFRGRTVLRAVLVAPWAAPTVAVTLIFAWMFNNSNGVFNSFATGLGFDRVGWLTDTGWAMTAVIAVTVWKLFPFSMLVILAALQSVPAELYEAAHVDGADSMNVFRNVVVPAITPTLRVLALLMTIWSFRRFEIIWLLTGGGPTDATNTVVIDVFREAFTNSQLGRSAAIGTIGLGMSLVVTLIYFAYERREP